MFYVIDILFSWEVQRFCMLLHTDNVEDIGTLKLHHGPENQSTIGFPKYFLCHALRWISTCTRFEPTRLVEKGLGLKCHYLKWRLHVNSSVNVMFSSFDLLTDILYDKSVSGDFNFGWLPDRTNGLTVRRDGDSVPLWPTVCFPERRPVSLTQTAA